MSAETPVERRLAQLQTHIVKGLDRRPDDRVTAYCSQPDVDALAAGREALALLRRIADGDIDESRIVKAAAELLDRIA